jgi:Fe-S cluster assembly protein SufD
MSAEAEMTAEDRSEKFVRDLLDGTDNLEGPTGRHRLRSDALDRLEDLRVPAAKDEEWRFVRLRPMLDVEIGPTPSAESDAVRDLVESKAVAEADGRRLVFVNGEYSETFSSLDGFGDDVHAGRIAAPDEADLEAIDGHLGSASTLFEEDYFSQINEAGFRDGGYVIVPPNTAVDGPVQLLNVVTDAEEPFAVQPRALIVAGRGSKVSVVEDFVGAQGSTYVNNCMTEVRVEASATVDHVVVQADSESAYHMNRRAIDMDDGSTYNSRTISYGATFSRFDVRSRGDGEDIDCTLDGLAVLKDDQVSDTHSVMDHRQGHSGSHQLHKMIIDDESHAVFNGKIFVRQHAQKIDAYQLNRTLPLSRKAKVNTKPQLEIFADDVSCTHGATIGQLEPEQLFYLRARGLTEEQARELLIFGFAAEIIDTVPVESVRDRIADAVKNRTRKLGS